MPELDDDRLVARCRRGDPRALAELYRRHASPLLGYLVRITGGRADRRHEALAAAALSGMGASPSDDPARAAELRDLVGVVDSALSDLPPAYAQAFYLRVHEGWSYRDLASLSGEPEGTLRSRVHHALARIQRILRQRDPDRMRGPHRKEKQP